MEMEIVCSLLRIMMVNNEMKNGFKSIAEEENRRLVLNNDIDDKLA
jgi:hypothetical protein